MFIVARNLTLNSISDYNMEANGVQEGNSYLRYKVDKLMKERKDLSQKCEDLEAKVESHDKLLKERRDLSQIFEDLEAKVESHDKFLKERKNFSQKCEDLEAVVDSRDKKIEYLETCIQDIQRYLPIDIGSKFQFLDSIVKQTVQNISFQQKETIKQRERLNSLAFEFESFSNSNSRSSSRANSPDRITSTFEDGEIQERKPTVINDELSVVSTLKNASGLEERLAHIEEVIADLDTKPMSLKEIVLENMRNIKNVDDRLKDAKKKLDDIRTDPVQDDDTKPLLLRMTELENTVSSIKHNVSKIKDRMKDSVTKKPSTQVVTYCQYENVTVTSDDYKCLESSEYLNDVIIDFYLQFIKKGMQEAFDNSHIFTTYFYKALSSPFNLKKRKDKDNVTPNTPDGVYDRVKNWTKKVDLFEKDYIVVPVNEKSHWYLIIICFPGSVNVKTELEDTARRSSILVFDSLPDPENPRTEAVTRLRSYLTSEWAARRGLEAEVVFTEENMPQANPRVRGQLNSKDCGLFLLQFVQSFFSRTKEDLQWLDTERCHKELFTREEVNGKRAAIAQTIRDLAVQQAYNRLDKAAFDFPDINFVPEDLSIRKQVNAKTPRIAQNAIGSNENVKNDEDSEASKLVIDLEHKVDPVPVRVNSRDPRHRVRNAVSNTNIAEANCGEAESGHPSKKMRIA